MHTIQLDLQISEALEIESSPESLAILFGFDKLAKVIEQHLAVCKPHVISIRFVDKDESVQLNKTFRNKDKASNVLSFPAELPDYIDTAFTGDIAICVPVVIDEAHMQNKHYPQHMQHILLHGILHLMGYDHITEEDAEQMEALEIAILAQLGIDDPYLLH